GRGSATRSPPPGTANTLRTASIDATGVPALRTDGVVTASPSQYATTSATSASSARGTSGGKAAVAITSPAAIRVRVPGSPANSRGATPSVSTTGPGTAW